MSCWGRSIHSAYSSSNRSRRRRLSLIGRTSGANTAESEQPFSPFDDEPVPADGNLSAWTLHAAHPPPDARHLVSVNGGDPGEISSATAQPTQRHTEGGELDEIRRLLIDQRPLTWIFTGDTSAGPEQPGGQRSCSELFSRHVRNELERWRDAVIDTGVPRSRAAALLHDLGWRSTRFRPDVVCLMIGPAEAKPGRGGRLEFRETLLQLIERIRSDCGRVLLNTPTPPPSRAVPNNTHPADAADLPAYADIVRYVADDAAAPLIDHWTDHQRRIAAGTAAEPYTPQAMAGLILSELGILTVEPEQFIDTA